MFGWIHVLMWSNRCRGLLCSHSLEMLRTLNGLIVSPDALPYVYSISMEAKMCITSLRGWCCRMLLAKHFDDLQFPLYIPIKIVKHCQKKKKKTAKWLGALKYWGIGMSWSIKNINIYLTYLYLMAKNQNSQHVTMYDQSVGEEMNCGLYCINLFFIQCNVPTEYTVFVWYSSVYKPSKIYFHRHSPLILLSVDMKDREQSSLNTFEIFKFYNQSWSWYLFLWKNSTFI